MHFFTSESVCDGHPDKFADAISDAILDEALRQDPDAHVAAETLAANGVIHLAGEITADAHLDYREIVEGVIRDVGYTDEDLGSPAKWPGIINSIHSQSPEIHDAVEGDELGAGDQGIMFGYATDETAYGMPMPIAVAHAMSRALHDARTSGEFPWLKSDAKTQATVLYDDEGRPQDISTILVSAQHEAGVSEDELRHGVLSIIAPVLESFDADSASARYIINPSGSFVLGGPAADCGLTGRKVIVDTYGGAARHGGGCFSGKSPQKVDRSAAYALRQAALSIVRSGLASRAEVQAAYSIGVAEPVSIMVDTFGTGVVSDEIIAGRVEDRIDLRPAAIIERLGLKAPIYSKTTNFGHFGKPDLPWERPTDLS